MIKIYGESIIIYSIILYSLAMLFKTNILKNGWIESTELDDKWFGFCRSIFLSCIPVLRFLCAVALLIAAFVPKDYFTKNH